MLVIGRQELWMSLQAQHILASSGRASILERAIPRLPTMVPLPGTTVLGFPQLSALQVFGHIIVTSPLQPPCLLSLPSSSPMTSQPRICPWFFSPFVRLTSQALAWITLHSSMARFISLFLGPHIRVKLLQTKFWMESYIQQTQDISCDAVKICKLYLSLKPSCLVL